MTSQPIRAVTLDFWNTLFVEVAPRISQERAKLITAHLSSFGVEMPALEVEKAIAQAWHIHRTKWKSGCHYTNSEAAAIITNLLKLPPTQAITDAIFTGLEYMYPASRLTPCGDIHGLIQGLKGANIALGIICDTGFTPGCVLMARLATLNFKHYFAGASFSDEVGACKPNPAIFEHSLGYLHSVPSETVHVGDLWRNDVMGARHAGFRTVRYREFNDDKPVGADADCVANNYDEIVEWILR